MSVTNAISSVIIVGAIIAALANNMGSIFTASSLFGYLAIGLAAINIFGGFLVTQRMLAMYKKKRIRNDFSKLICNILFDFWSVIHISFKRLVLPETSRQGNFFGIIEWLLLSQ